MKVPQGVRRYYLIYDAYNDVAEPISKRDAYRVMKDARQVKDVHRESSKGLGYDLDDGDILVAFKLSDLEKEADGLKVTDDT